MERNMLIYNQTKYQTIITDEMIDDINMKFGIQCLFGGMFGNQVYGIDNSVSDYDFIFVYKKCSCQMNMFRLFEEITYTDIILIDICHLLHCVTAYFQADMKFPSILYRKKLDFGSKHNIFQSDFYSHVLFEIISSDYIWDSGYLKKNVTKLQTYLRVIFEADYYYSRAYGNLFKNLNRQKVPAIKYLTTLIGIGAMREMLEENSMPLLEIDRMIEKYCPVSLKETYRDIVKAQKELREERDVCFHLKELQGMYTMLPAESYGTEKKPAVFVPQKPKLNQWIAEQLKEIELRCRMAEKDTLLNLEKSFFYNYKDNCINAGGGGVEHCKERIRYQIHFYGG